MKRLHVFVSGKVQGVFFRSFVKKEAEALSLNGWVRNLSDGRVEAIVEGNNDSVDMVLERISQGSPQSKIDKIEFHEENCLNEFNNFSII